MTFGQENKSAFPTNEQMRQFKAIANPKLSPDGKHVLVQVTDSTADGAKSHLWLIDVDGGGQRQLTYSPDGDRAGESRGEWMPDGQSILFTAHRGEHTSLYQLPMSGGEAKKIELKVTPMVDMSKVPDAIPPVKGGGDKKDDKAEPIVVDPGGFRVSPNGKSIAFTIRDPETPGEKKQKDAKADAAWVNHDQHGTRLYIMDVATGKLTLAGVEPDVRGVAWSPDSARLAVLTEGTNEAGDLGPAGTVWLLPASDLAHPVRTDLPPTTGSMTWNADGSALLFTAASKQDAPPGYSDLYIKRMAGAGGIGDLTAMFMGSMGRGEPIALKSGETLALVEQGFDVAPARVFADGQTKVLKMPTATVSGFSTNDAQNGWVFLGSDGAHPTGLYYMATLDAAPRVLATPKLIPDGLATVAARRIEWKSDQFTIQGVLYLPPEAASHKVPLVVQVHGGPLGAYSDSYAAFTNFLLGHGWAVLESNPRGSTGRGAAFAAANKNDLGGGDYRDIMAGVDFVLKTEPIDAERTALMGYSYGGEMAAFVEGKTARFKAIVSCAPVIDQQSEYGTERGSWYDRWYYGKPWEHQADAWRQSPLSGAANAKTLFMLIQGESDTTDPLGQSLEMYRALRQEGVAVELVTYPRDDHGPLGGAIYGTPSREPWHGFDARQRIVAFFEKNFGK